MLKYVLYLSAGLLMFNSLAVANDYVNDEAAKKGAVREAGRIYEEISGNKPTVNNMLKSIETEEGKNKSNEAWAALRVLTLMEPKTSEITEKVLKCSEAYKNDNIVELQCGEYLIKIEDKRNKGIEILRSLIRDPKAELSIKLHAATGLAKVGVLDGYPLVREGLASNAITQIAHKRLAVYLLNRYIPYNGKTYNDKGDKIDIEGIISSFKDKVDSETSSELMRTEEMLHDPKLLQRDMSWDY